MQVLKQLMEAIEQQLGALLRESLQPQSGLHVFSFLSNSILAAADETLAESLPGAHQAPNQSQMTKCVSCVADLACARCFPAV